MREAEPEMGPEIEPAQETAPLVDSAPQINSAPQIESELATNDNKEPTEICKSTKPTKRKVQAGDDQEDAITRKKRVLGYKKNTNKDTGVQCEVVEETKKEKKLVSEGEENEVKEVNLKEEVKAMKVSVIVQEIGGDELEIPYSVPDTDVQDLEEGTEDVPEIDTPEVLPDAEPKDLSDTASGTGNETAEVDGKDQEPIVTTDWSKIPFPPFYAGQQVTVEETTEKSVFQKVEKDIRVTDEELKDLCYRVEDKLFITRRSPKDMTRAYSKLPKETWIDIMDLIDNRADLFHLSMVNSFFYRFAIPKLYQRLNIRSPYNRRDVALPHGAGRERHKIPLNQLLREPSLPDHPNHLAPWKMLKYVQELTIDHWDSPWNAARRDMLDPLSPYTISYDVWKGYNFKEPSPHMIQLFIGDPDSDLPLVSLNTELANLISTKMPNLTSFIFKPEPGYIQVVRSQNDGAPYIHLSMLIVPTLTFDILDALKALPKLRHLCIDFSYHEPLGLNRMHSSQGYNSLRHGLVGFKRLEKLHIIMAAPDYRQRTRELSRVICDCICSGNLREIGIVIKNDYRNTLNQSYPEMKTLCETIWKSLFADTILKAEKTPRAVPLLRLDVSLTCTFLSCTFRTCGHGDVKTAYDVDWKNLISVSDLSPSILTNPLIGSRSLTRLQSQNLQKLHLRCSIASLGPLLKATHGLKQLIVIAPASRERLRVEEKHRNSLHIRHNAAYKVTTAINHPKGHITKMNRILDYLVKHHLLHLEVLVIDELIPCPKSYSIPTLNSLSSWKSRAHNVREVGLHLWGPWEQIVEFMGVFTVAKYLHLFNAVSPNHGMYVKGMPDDIQITTLECIQRTSWWCNTAMVACMIGRKLAEVITGEDNKCRVNETNLVGTGTITGTGTGTSNGNDKAKTLSRNTAIIGPMESKNGPKGLRDLDIYGPTPPGTTGLTLFRPSKIPKPATESSKLEPPSIRWLAVGPWYINAQANWRWKWDEDEAKNYIHHWKKLEFYGKVKGWFGLEEFGTHEMPWRKESIGSVMWAVFDGYVKR
ncbi:hypothetical protein BZA77DRAFT_357217 [Pyronema omphalodes]|nr:hypothetical protein BZA77DRAFT_357217 [Pyronema omphalodes]